MSADIRAHATEATSLASVHDMGSGGSAAGAVALECLGVERRVE